MDVQYRIQEDSLINHTELLAELSRWLFPKVDAHYLWPGAIMYIGT